MAVPEPLFLGILIKQKLRHKWFPVKFAKLVRRENIKSQGVQMFPKKVRICFVYI